MIGVEAIKRRLAGPWRPAAEVLAEAEAVALRARVATLEAAVADKTMALLEARELLADAETARGAAVQRRDEAEAAARYSDQVMGGQLVARRAAEEDRDIALWRCGQLVEENAALLARLHACAAAANGVGVGEGG